MADEIVALVDKNDQQIGQKNRHDLTDDDCWRIVSIWVENSHGQVLLQQRSLDKATDPGCWTPAAEGTVVLGEDYDSTAVRELEEEIGLTDHPLRKQNKVWTKFQFGSRQFQAYTVACDWPVEQFTAQASEVAALEWVDKQQVIAEITGQTTPTRLWPVSAHCWPAAFGLV
jgi:16S rRNA (adenine1518-N6/adenine1519-N6)-dimethyltransferase